MHWSRRIRRGANRADTLADAISRDLSIPTRQRLLKFRRRTQKQSLLPIDSRRRNIAGAFIVRKSYVLRDCHVGLVDDIMTTGATANEATRALLAAGGATRHGDRRGSREPSDLAVDDAASEAGDDAAGDAVKFVTLLFFQIGWLVEHGSSEEIITGI